MFSGEYFDILNR